jgi:hypothetical protein
VETLQTLQASYSLTGRLRFDGKAKKEGGRSEIWREGRGGGSWVGLRRQSYGVLPLGRFSTHERRPFPAHPSPAGHVKSSRIIKWYNWSHMTCMTHDSISQMW